MLALTETWAKRDEANMLQIEGYSLTLQERADQRGGGVAIYVKRGFTLDACDLPSITSSVIKFKIRGTSNSQIAGLL